MMPLLMMMNRAGDDQVADNAGEPENTDNSFPVI